MSKAVCLHESSICSSLAHTVLDLEEGVYVRYRLDGSLFDPRRLTAKTKRLRTLIQEAIFADDCAEMAHRDKDLQLMLDKFSEGSKLFGLTISLVKIEVVHQAAPNRNIPEPTNFCGWHLRREAGTV